MKKYILLFSISLSLFIDSTFSQTIEKNQSNEKYETTIEKKYNEKSKQYLFSEISEWLATYYSSKVNSLKFTDLTKGKKHI